MSARDAILAELLPDEIRLPIGTAAIQQGRLGVDGVVPASAPRGRRGRDRAIEVERLERQARLRHLARALGLAALTVGLVASAGLYAGLGVRPAAPSSAGAPAPVLPPTPVAVTASAAAVAVSVKPPLVPAVETPADAPQSARPKSAPEAGPRSSRQEAPASMVVLRAPAAVAPDLVRPAPAPAASPRAAQATPSEQTLRRPVVEPVLPPSAATSRTDGAGTHEAAPLKEVAVVQQRPDERTLNARYGGMGVLTLMPGAAIVNDKGQQRRVSVGEPLPGGEVLLGVEAAAGRIVTNLRTVQFTD